MLVKCKIALTAMMGVCVLLTGCKADSGKEINQLSIQSEPAQQRGKPVVLLVIDSLMDKP